MTYIDRPFYTHWLERWRDHDLIKVVTGIRRCGKSTLLALFRKKLAESGVSEKQMVVLNFEDPDTPAA